MTNRDDTIERYYALNPRSFPILLRLSLEHSYMPVAGLTLDLVLRPFEPNDHRRLSLSFHGVTDLRFEQKWSEISFPFIEITSVRDRHLEDLNYKVTDPENGSLFFWCKSFEAKIT